MKKSLMFKQLLLGFLLLLLLGCSYSPLSLESFYNDLASDIADELKNTIDLTPAQRAEIDRYAKELILWHRHYKLPVYAQQLALLANDIRQGAITPARLLPVVTLFDAIPHFDEARQLTYRITKVASSLNDKQVHQLQQVLNNEIQQDQLEIKQSPYATELRDGIKFMFRFMGVHLNQQQQQLVSQEAAQFADTRPLELTMAKRWNKQFIQSLQQRKSPQFAARFAQLWDHKSSFNAPQTQRNKQRMAELLSQLIQRLTPDQREKLVSQLTSISNTFSEMANK